MKLAVFTLVEHTLKDGSYHGYGPYIREMDLWTSYADEVIVVGLLSEKNQIDPIDLPYAHKNLSLVEVPKFHIKSIMGLLKTIMQFPLMFYKIFKVMKYCDQFHFRCPANVSAVAAIVQIFFPKKRKITKYAGNWDPGSNQPLGYRFQKWLLGNSFLTKNMTILVYGEWPNQSPYVRAFLSATYTEDEKISKRELEFVQPFKFIFVGSMVVGKRPLLTIKIIEALNNRNIKCSLDMFGDGDMMEEVKNYIELKQIHTFINIHGNQDKETVKDYYKRSHFSILPSKSEGWPKAMAEGMFFGAIPISTRISCLDWILGEGERGILIDADVNAAADKIEQIILTENLDDISSKAKKWSEQYTVNKLESEIRSLMTSQ